MPDGTSSAPPMSGGARPTLCGAVVNNPGHRGVDGQTLGRPACSPSRRDDARVAQRFIAAVWSRGRADQSRRDGRLARPRSSLGDSVSRWCHIPSDKSLGYYRVPLRGKTDRQVCLRPTPRVIVGHSPTCGLTYCTMCPSTHPTALTPLALPRRGPRLFLAAGQPGGRRGRRRSF